MSRLNTTGQTEDEETRNTNPSQRNCLRCFNLGKKKKKTTSINNEYFMMEKEAPGGDLKLYWLMWRRRRRFPRAEEGKRESSRGERLGMSGQSEQSLTDDFILFQIR